MGFGRTNRAAWSGVCNNPAEPARPSPGLFVITSKAGLDFVLKIQQSRLGRSPAESAREVAPAGRTSKTCEGFGQLAFWSPIQNTP